MKTRRELLIKLVLLIIVLTGLILSFGAILRMINSASTHPVSAFQHTVCRPVVTKNDWYRFNIPQDGGYYYLRPLGSERSDLLIEIDGKVESITTLRLSSDRRVYNLQPWSAKYTVALKLPPDSVFRAVAVEIFTSNLPLPKAEE